MQIRRSVVVRTSPEEVFALLSDVERYPLFFRGITRWQPCSEQLRGVGARFRVLMQVGSIEAGGTVVVTEWEPAQGRIAWVSERGITQHGRWLVEPVGDGGAHLRLQVGFELAGPVRWLVERLTGRIVARNLQATLLAARRVLESGHDPR